MKTCKTCYWWGLYDDESEEGALRRECFLATSYDGFYHYMNKKASKEETAHWKKSKMRSWDGEDYYAGLTTQHDFGCNQWKAKE